MDKVCPHINRGPYHYLKKSGGIYVYLHPWSPGDWKYNIDGTKIEFRFLPIYLGKYERARAFRPEQHISNFLRGKKDIQDFQKWKYFEEIDRLMKTHSTGLSSHILLPSNWKQYIRNGWLAIIKEFDDLSKLRRFEKDAIRTIGTMRDGTGPLVNVIKG